MIVTIILDIDNVPYVCRTFENESIQINRLVASLDNLDSQGTITKQSFRLPLVGDLLQALGDITDPSQKAKVNLNNSIKGRILIDGFPRFEGSFFVTNAVQGVTKEVEMIFQGSETDLKATLSNINMAELFEGQTLPYTFNELKNYFELPYRYIKDNGYLWPLVDYGDEYTFDSNASKGFIEDLFEINFKPAVTLTKCFEMLPINVTTNNINRIMHQAILLHNDKNKIPVLDTSPFDNTGFFSITSDSSLSGGFIDYIPLFDAKTPYNIDNTSIFDLSGKKFVVPVNGNYTFSISGSVDFTTSGGSGGAMFWRLSENSGASVKALFSENIFTDGIKTYSFELSAYYEAGDEVSMAFTSSGVDSLILKDGFKFEVSTAPALNSSSNVDIAANCPELTAWDIFRTVALQCNGQIIANSDGSYEITPWVDWIEEGTDVIVLDDIIEDGVDVQIKPFSVQGAKSVRLGYKDNDDLYSKKYKELTTDRFGDKFIANTGTEFAKNEIKIEVPLSVIPSVPINQSNAVIPKMYDDSFKIIKGKPTLIQTNYIEIEESGKFMDCPFNLKSIFDNSDIEVVHRIPYIGNWSYQEGGYDKLDNNFGQSLSYWRSTGYPYNNLYQQYWRKYIEETYSEQSREIKMNIKLETNQIDGLKFNEKFYYKNTLLRLIKLEGVSLTSQQPASATFMKRFTIYNSDISPFYPTDIINSIVQWADSSDNTDLSPADGSGANQADLEQSAIAYGFFYDSVQDIATQNGQILIT